MPAHQLVYLGGYAFITNMIPLHALILILMGRFTSRLYVGYSSWYAIGTLASMQVPFVGFQPVKTSEHMAALGKCSPCHAYCYLLTQTRRRIWPPPNYCLCPACPFPLVLKTIPKSTLCCCHWNGHTWLASNRRPYLQRLDRSLDWPFLLAMGYRLRQEVRVSPFDRSNFNLHALDTSLSSHQSLSISPRPGLHSLWTCSFSCFCSLLASSSASSSCVMNTCSLSSTLLSAVTLLESWCA